MVSTYDVNRMVKALQVAVAFTRDVDEVSLTDEELLGLIRVSLAVGERDLWNNLKTADTEEVEVGKAL